MPSNLLGTDKQKEGKPTLMEHLLPDRHSAMYIYVNSHLALQNRHETWFYKCEL